MDKKILENDLSMRILINNKYTKFEVLNALKVVVDINKSEIIEMIVDGCNKETIEEFVQEKIDNYLVLNSSRSYLS